MVDDRPADPNPLIGLLRACVVRIDGASGTFRGSGFLRRLQGTPGDTTHLEPLLG